MAKPFGLDLAANSGSNEQSQDDILMSWYGDDARAASPAVNDNYTPFNSPAANESAARNLALDEYLSYKRDNFRKALFADPLTRTEAPVVASTNGSDAVPAITLINDRGTAAERRPEEVKTPTFTPTNLEITQSPEVPKLTKINPQPEAPTDMGFAQLKQLAGPGSMSSQWMAAARPDLAAQFNSDACALQLGSRPDGTVFKIITSPEGNSWMMTAKGSTTVEIIADRSGQELFKHSSRSNPVRETSMTA